MAKSQKIYINKEKKSASCFKSAVHVSGTYNVKQVCKKILP